MEFTTHLELHSQTTRLFEGASQKALVICAKDGIITLCDVLFQKTYAQASADSTSLNYNSDRYKSCQISNLSFSLFTRSY
jgi:hypothetical protein